MSQHERFLGTVLHLVSAAREGLMDAGILEEDVDGVLAGFAGGKSKAAIRDAAFSHGVSLLRRKGKIIDRFDLPEGNVFLVEGYHEIEVDYTPSPEEIGRHLNFDQEEWQHVATSPALGVRKVKVAIGHMNKAWTEEGIARILSVRNSPLRGSGAWVMEAYLGLHQGREGSASSIDFPDAETSRWLWKQDRHIYFTGLAREKGTSLKRQLLWGKGNKTGIKRRLCLMVVEGDEADLVQPS